MHSLSIPYKYLAFPEQMLEVRQKEEMVQERVSSFGCVSLDLLNPALRNYQVHKIQKNNLNLSSLIHMYRDAEIPPVPIPRLPCVVLQTY